MLSAKWQNHYKRTSTVILWGQTNPDRKQNVVNRAWGGGGWGRKRYKCQGDFSAGRQESSMLVVMSSQPWIYQMSLTFFVCTVSNPVPHNARQALYHWVTSLIVSRHSKTIMMVVTLAIKTKHKGMNWGCPARKRLDSPGWVWQVASHSAVVSATSTEGKHLPQMPLLFT